MVAKAGLICGFWVGTTVGIRVGGVVAITNLPDD
jgi:hypothetical protein